VGQLGVAERPKHGKVASHLAALPDRGEQRTAALPQLVEKAGRVGRLGGLMCGAQHGPSPMWCCSVSLAGRCPTAVWAVFDQRERSGGASIRSVKSALNRSRTHTFPLSTRAQKAACAFASWEDWTRSPLPANPCGCRRG